MTSINRFTPARFCGAIPPNSAHWSRMDIWVRCLTNSFRVLRQHSLGVPHGGEPRTLRRLAVGASFLFDLTYGFTY